MVVPVVVIPWLLGASGCPEYRIFSMSASGSSESEPDITAVTQDSLSDAVHEGDSVSLHCSVLSHLEKKTCPEERKVFWFQVSSPQSHPSIIYAQNEGDGKCEENPESQSGQRCVFNFVKDSISSSDTGTYYCALAACGMVVFGNGTKLEFKDVSINNSQRNNTLLLLLCGILVLMLIATALLVYLIRKKCCHFSKGPEFPGKNECSSLWAIAKSAKK
ncbi:T-cell surface glycoprotein CD8 beta chain-like [Xiphophorus hellerii]|uniref:T-cell surface glycoprotein CD8 beta chain-like n=1 Tax=Xiphophorus hellerii TaxID=8084 RepID=UPI0013B36EAC|nr:T-cell surface glycoprotein CD8 beta chain-like [Xiphophorus hellerii]